LTFFNKKTNIVLSTQGIRYPQQTHHLLSLIVLIFVILFLRHISSHVGIVDFHPDLNEASGYICLHRPHYVVCFADDCLHFQDLDSSHPDANSHAEHELGDHHSYHFGQHDHIHHDFVAAVHFVRFADDCHNLETYYCIPVHFHNVYFFQIFVFLHYFLFHHVFCDNLRFLKRFHSYNFVCPAFFVASNFLSQYVHVGDLCVCFLLY